MSSVCTHGIRIPTKFLDLCLSEQTEVSNNFVINILLSLLSASDVVTYAIRHSFLVRVGIFVSGTVCRGYICTVLQPLIEQQKIHTWEIKV